MGLFEQIPSFAPDSILGLAQAFQEDPREDKINLLLGTYEREKKRYGGFSSVKKAQTVYFDDEKDKNYLPIKGSANFLEEIAALYFGEIDANRWVGVQSIGGTGALHLGASVYAKAALSGKVYIPAQTWGNHTRIFAHQGLSVEHYPYYDQETKELDLQGLKSTLRAAPESSLILFHCCCHNPTGKDIPLSVWPEIIAIIKERDLIPFFDMAYLGFAYGIEEDRKPVRLCIEEGIPTFVAGSSSKNFSLYGSRVGFFGVLHQDKHDLSRILSFLEEKIRGEYSSPAREGAAIVASILGNPYLRQEWELELNGIRQSLENMRANFVFAMRNIVGHSFDFIGSQKGFFGYPDFSKEQVVFLREELGIYTTAGGRFNLNGITDKNINRVTHGFAQAYEYQRSIS
ncbi:aromatic amino acid transaminase [Chlamydia sp.]|uniref:amino acid aminotransferase n=1 Tax=Chlamydia sp. TaxID=35827 RepID=UPI0025C01766|nr:aromatic amino acid transaminase [Chlamydia sp.]MBQ8498868.1 aromatic amino acid transaminase [Chlamydia sp.]